MAASAAGLSGQSENAAGNAASASAGSSAESAGAADSAAGAPGSAGAGGMNIGEAGAVGNAVGGSGGAAGAGGGAAGAGGGAAGAGGAAAGNGGVGGGSMVKPVCGAGPFPVPAMQSAKNVCADFKFTYDSNEGPTWIASQHAFFFSNYAIHQASGGDIIKYTPGGACETFITGVGCNGLAVSNDGNLLAACQQSRSVVRFDLATKQATTVADSYMGMMLDSPNDLVQHKNGTIYFTNPDFELGGRTPGVGLAVFRVDPAGAISLIANTRCNGIALSPDQKLLYVLQAGVWDLDAAGVPANPRPLFATGDGMAVDCAGNLYTSGDIFSPQGKDLGDYVTGGTNLAFGGDDAMTVLVVGRGTLVRELRMNVPGFP